MKKVMLFIVAIFAVISFCSAGSQYSVKSFDIHTVKNGDTWASILSVHNHNNHYSEDVSNQVALLNPTVTSLSVGEKVQVPVFK